MATETITPGQAQLWLAGLEKPCSDCQLPVSFHAKPELDPWCQPCGGTGKVPVLDLRKPCPLLDKNPGEYSISRQTVHELRGINCKCQGRGWVPKQGEAALHHAMHKDRWGYTIWQPPNDSRITANVPRGRGVAFWKGSVYEYDANDFLAAAKAMKAMKAKCG